MTTVAGLSRAVGGLNIIERTMLWFVVVWHITATVARLATSRQAYIMSDNSDSEDEVYRGKIVEIVDPRDYLSQKTPEEVSHQAWARSCIDAACAAV